VGGIVFKLLAVRSSTLDASDGSGKGKMGWPDT